MCLFFDDGFCRTSTVYHLALGLHVLFPIRNFMIPTITTTTITTTIITISKKLTCVRSGSGSLR